MQEQREVVSSGSSRTSGHQNKAAGEEEIDLLELLYMLWEGRWIITGFSTVAVILSLVYAFSLPDIYRAEALLAPSSPQEPGGLSAIASQYGGLASLAGINLGSYSGGENKTVFGLEVLQSRRFIGKFVVVRDILVPLMAADGWDADRNTLRYDKSLYEEEVGKWILDNRSPEPSLLQASAAFRELMQITRDSDTGFVKVSVEHYSPFIAKQWVDWLIADINAEIRAQDISEAERSVLYLTEQLAATPLAELQTVFYQLIEEQTKTIMLANARPEYLFRTIDPSVVPEEKYEPRRAIIAVFGTLVGLFLSLAFLFIRYISLSILSKQ